MLVRGTVRLLPLISLALVIFFAIARYKRAALLKSWSFEHGQWAKEVVVPMKISTEENPSPAPSQIWNQNPTGSNEDGHIDLNKITLPLPEQDSGLSTISNTHNEIFSLSTSSGRYFPISFGEYETLNPNIIPHPSSDSKWIIVAQQKTQDDVPAYSRISVQLVCDALFRPSDDGHEYNNHDNNYFINAGGKTGNEKSLTCVTTPNILPIAATNSGNRCQGRWAPLSLNVGPHDARLFYGPQIPYVIYGSNSRYTCFGQWIHDFRMLFDWTSLKEGVTGIDESDDVFRTPTELYRPAPYGEVEKNWFIFWDTNGDAYVHYDVWPQRSFAKIESQKKSHLLGDKFPDSSIVGPDLAILSSTADASCMNRYMPEIQDFSNEFIHQATNSLSITLCKRSELNCLPSDFNTFIFTIFQKKVHVRGARSSYEPYAMLFRRTAPFELHGISTKPFWIHGRKTLQQEAAVREMMYVTSMSWMNHGQKYHGYSDDTLFLAFGIDDSRTAGIDVQAGDLLKDMGICLNS
jgi:hypothetical protein